MGNEVAKFTKSGITYAQQTRSILSVSFISITKFQVENDDVAQLSRVRQGTGRVYKNFRGSSGNSESFQTKTFLKIKSNPPYVFS